MRGLLVAFAFLFAVASASDVGPPARADTYARAHRPVATTSALAQDAFDDGLTLLYAFDPEEARRAFERAIAADPTLALAWWGVAMSHGVNINTDFDAAEQRRGRDAVARARTLDRADSPVDRALVDAATRRFARDRTIDETRSATDYRDAMAAAADAFPNDDDVQTFAAEAEMDVHPWSYFGTDGAPTPGTAALIARLQTVRARDPTHLGASHLLVHALEESPHPERALAAARYLANRSFEPAAEHLAHMPAHTFMRVGAYRDAGDANARAIALYERYLAGDHAGHADYLGHDCLFGIDAYMMAGEEARARALVATCGDNARGMRPIVDLRFERWSAVASDGSENDLVRGLLDAHDGALEGARRHARALRAITGDLPALQAHVVDAAVARASGDGTAEIAALVDAVAVQDRFGYAEPPTFWYPVRESLGDAYLRLGRLHDAETTFRADLARNAANPRSTYGLAATLAREGRADEARAEQATFAAAWQHADAPPEISGY